MSKIFILLIWLGFAGMISCKKDTVMPTVTTTDLTEITINSVTAGGKILSSGGARITESGVCWSTTPEPDITGTRTSDSTYEDMFTSSITGLSSGTTYYVRAYATNRAGTAYGDEISFYTLIADTDGNAYDVVKIGDQIWMKEDLKTTRYSNGDAIGTTATVITDISAEVAPKYEWIYNGDEEMLKTYGRLYTWFVATDTRNVCPTNFHVPTHKEWVDLREYLGGESVAGGQLKEAGTTNWLTPNTGATNTSGFTALPSGYRSILGEYDALGTISYHWSTDPETDPRIWGIELRNTNGEFVTGAYNRNDGLPVRCLKN
jgi:uncharacterized protein (TIGR02145 family)